MSTNPVVLLRDTQFGVVLQNQTVPVVPMSSVHPVGPKGDPGGNIMSIGLFEDADTLTISAGTDVVRTSGYSAIGIGIADYRADLAVDAAYVAAHPRTAFISANSRGFRLDVSAGVNLFQTGGVGDLSTDNTAALEAARDALAAEPIPGGRLFIPRGKFKFLSHVHFYNQIRITGDGWGENPGTVDGVTYSFPTNYYGSLLVFPAGVSGLEFHPFTTEEDIATVVGALAAHKTEHSAYGSSIEGVAVISLGNGAAGTDNGLRSRTRINLRNFMAYGFGQDGVLIEASSDVSDTLYGNVYGNANLSVLDNVRGEKNGRDGIRLRGRDANDITLTNPDCRANGAWGTRYMTVSSCTQFGGHYDGNNRLLAASATATIGSIKTEGAVAFHDIRGPWIEQSGGYQTDLSIATKFEGGLGSNELYHPTTTRAMVVNVGQAIGKGYSGKNRVDATYVTGGIGLGPSATGKVAWWFGSADEASEDVYALKYGFSHTGIWSLAYRGGPVLIEFPSGQASFYATLTNAVSPGFPNGMGMGQMNSAPRILPANTAVPGGTYRRGDIIFNSAPSAAGKVGWICVTAGTPGTWKQFGVIDA